MIKHVRFITPLIGLLLTALSSGKTYGLWNWFKYSVRTKFVNGNGEAGRIHLPADDNPVYEPRLPVV